MSSFTSASILLTDTCNLNCKYCFEKNNSSKGKFMSNEIGEKTIDLLIHDALVNNKTSISVSYFGGEPTLNINTMNHIFNYAMDQCKKHGLKYNSELITNGVLYNNEYEQFLTNWWVNNPESFSIQLSFDSIPRINDLQRIDHAGNGSSHNIIETIKKLRALFDKLDIPSNKLSVHSVITKATLPYAHESYIFFKNILRFDKIWFMPLHEENWDENDYVIFREQYTHIANAIIEDCENSGGNYKQFSSMVYKERHADKTCGAGVSFCTVAPDGYIYPCHAFMNDPDTIIGDVFNGINTLKCAPYEEMYKKYMTGYKACSECKNYNCKSCMAINYIENGNIAYGFPKYCKLLEVEMELSIYVYERLFGKIHRDHEVSITVLQEMGRLLTDNFTEGQIITLQHLLELHELLITEKVSRMINEKGCSCNDTCKNNNRTNGDDDIRCGA
jgi:radical SAM protein with 4Fe4S-binding SPASM domain